MQVVRVVGEYKEDGESTGARLFVLCGVDEDGRMVDGEWFGYDRYEDGVEQPFLVRVGETVDFGGEPKEVLRTNIGERSQSKKARQDVYRRGTRVARSAYSKGR